MRLKSLKLSVLLLLGLSLTELHAQEITLASGGEAIGNGGSASFSVGQVVYATYTGTNGSVVQGVQQIYDISNVSRLEEVEGIYIECSVYPNPTTDFLILKIEGIVQMQNIVSQQYAVSLYNIEGELLENKMIEGNETIIDMLNLIPGTYFLKIGKAKTNNHKDAMHCISTFKIIKN